MRPAPLIDPSQLSATPSSARDGTSASEELSIPEDEETGLLNRGPTGPATFNALFQIAVLTKHKSWLEKDWLVDLYATVSSFRGFLHSAVHLIVAQCGYCQYAINITFDSVESHNRWVTSEERVLKMKSLHQKDVKVFKINQYGGMIPVGEGDLMSKDGQLADVDAAMSRAHVQDAMQYLPRPQPPPKWKLCIIIYINVITVILIERVGGSTTKMIAAGVPPGLAIFFAQFHMMPFMSFCSLPLSMALPFVSYWMRLPRPRLEDLHPVLAVLEQGLRMFAVTPTDVQLQQRVSRLEERLDRLRMSNHDLANRVGSIAELRGGSRGGDSSPQLDPSLPFDKANAVQKALNAHQDGGSTASTTPSSIKVDPLANSSGPLTMVVRHYIKWERVLDFEQWTDRMDEEMRRHRGYQGMIRVGPKCDNDPFINSFTFDTLENLMEFQKSQHRLQLLQELEPMLEAVSEADLTQERVISDAFSELFVSTGEAAHLRPPPVWKSMVLTTASLVCIIWLAGVGIGNVLAQQPTIDRWGSLFIGVAVTVPLETWIGLPSMQYLFGEWLRLPVPREGSFGCSVCRFLDDGLTLRGQLLFLAVYCSLNIGLGLSGH